jgi:hypothetical protein
VARQEQQARAHEQAERPARSVARSLGEHHHGNATPMLSNDP